jgi:hypothetical protein
VLFTFILEVAYDLEGLGAPPKNLRFSACEVSLPKLSLMELDKEKRLVKKKNSPQSLAANFNLQFYARY